MPIGIPPESVTYSVTVVVIGGRTMPGRVTPGRVLVIVRVMTLTPCGRDSVGGDSGADPEGDSGPDPGDVSDGGDGLAVPMGMPPETVIYSVTVVVVGGRVTPGRVVPGNVVVKVRVMTLIP